MIYTFYKKYIISNNLIYSNILRQTLCLFNNLRRNKRFGSVHLLFNCIITEYNPKDI